MISIKYKKQHLFKLIDSILPIGNPPDPDSLPLSNTNNNQ